MMGFAAFGEGGGPGGFGRGGAGGGGCPGCGDGVADGSPPGATPGNSQFGLNSLDANFSLGGASFNTSAGRLYISEEVPSWELATPTKLKWEADPATVTVLSN